jgi:hypothetical protein
MLNKSILPHEPCDVFGVKEFEEIRIKTVANYVCER